MPLRCLKFAARLDATLLRTVSLGAFLTFAIFTGGLHEDSNRHHDLKGPPYNPNLLPSLRILYVAVSGVFRIADWNNEVGDSLVQSSDLAQGSFGAGWTYLGRLLAWPALLMDDVDDHGLARSLSTFCAIVDLILGVILCHGIQMQTAYLPPTRARCSEASSWQVSAGEPSLFQRIGDPRTSSAQSICEDFMNTWGLGIALMYVLPPVLPDCAP